MLRLLLVAFITLILNHSAPAQTCEQFTHVSPKHRKVLQEYIQFCESEGVFKGDTGIIMLHQRMDKLGQIEWYIGVSYQDYYLDRKPPMGWSTVAGKLILWYDNFSLSTDPKLTIDEQICLAKIVDKRVTKRPSLPHPTPVLDIDGKPKVDRNGKPIMFTRHILYGGVPGVDMHIIFKKDGSVSKLVSV